MPENILKNNYLKEIFKGSMFAFILSIFFVLIFALIARLFSFNADVIPTINIVIKVTSVFCSVTFFAKINERGLIKGAGVAIGFLFVSYLFFVLLGGKTWANSLLFDLILCIIAGVVGGIISVNRKK